MAQLEVAMKRHGTSIELLGSSVDVLVLNIDILVLNSVDVLVFCCHVIVRRLL